MAGGGYQEPSVLTHFLPGMVLGIVLGAITGALIITHIASTSLQFFWEASRVKAYSPQESCADASGVHMAAYTSENGGALTQITIGNGQETLLTLSRDRLRFVPINHTTSAYLTAVASVSQQEAFPATSLYRIDYCAKTLTHILGNAEEPTNILGVSPSGTWVVYGKESLRLMNVQDKRVQSFTMFADVADIAFSQADDGGALLFTDGTGIVWSFSENEEAMFEDVFFAATSLPSWTFQSPAEYFATMQ